MAKVSPKLIGGSLTEAQWRRTVAPTKPALPFDAVAAKFSQRFDRLDITLRNGIKLGFPRSDIEELHSAKPSQLARIDIQPGGDGISIRAIDVDISVPGLLADMLGGAFARALGRRAKGRTSAKKAAASRRNGRRGGRPRVKASAA